MISITFNRSGDQPTFMPGETISGFVTWSDIGDTQKIETRLIWYTIGKGDRDAQYVDAITIDDVTERGRSDFQFTAPHRPNSFSGNLIAIQWAIEVIAFPQRDAEQALMSIHPRTGAVSVTPVDDDEAFGNKSSWIRLANSK